MTPLEFESLVAAIGPDKIIAGKPTLHRYQLERAASMPRDIRRRILRFLGTDAFEPAHEMPPFDWDETFALVTGGEDPERSRAIYAVVPDREMAMDLGTRAQTIRQWADGLMPREMREVSFDESAPLDEPSESSQADFRRQWQAVVNPMLLLDDLEDGSLIDEQVAAVAANYPALYAEMRQAVSDGIAAIKARKGKDWEPTPVKATLLGTLRQKTVADPELTAAVQEAYAEGSAAAAQRVSATRTSRKKAANPELTPGTRATAGGGSPTPL